AGRVVEVAADDGPLRVYRAEQAALQVAAARLDADRPRAVAVAVDADLLVVEVPEDVGGVAQRARLVDAHADVGAALAALRAGGEPAWSGDPADGGAGRLV